jgi:hypothetical protein
VPHAFSVIHYRVATQPTDDEFYAPTDIAVPVIDDVPFFETVGDRYPGVAVGLVTPPSRHWLGEPRYGENGRAVILDGTCGHAGCCGVLARITIADALVTWSDFFARGHPELPEGLHFQFDRTTYQEAIAGVMNREPTDWVFDLGDYG